jgi:hypothetical protein
LAHLAHGRRRSQYPAPRRYEFLFEPTPRTVAINEALEIARRFSTYEATQFINGILDAIKRDLDEQQPQRDVQPEAEDGADE